MVPICNSLAIDCIEQVLWFVSLIYAEIMAVPDFA